MKIKDSDFGALKFDEDLEAWTGHLKTPAFAGCKRKWRLSPLGNLREWPADDDDDVDDKKLEIVVADGDDGEGPGPMQRAALAAFRANEAAVRAAVLAEIARVARENYVTTKQLPPTATSLTSQRELADRLCTPAGVTEWLDPPSIQFHATGKKGVAYTSFNFGAGFDDEHGIAVLMLADRVQEVGGSGEFYDR
jgi:hypothetical protein